jgi:FAD/FMN-containing dehydrogenase/Fe-S oxidoreductase
LDERRARILEDLKGFFEGDLEFRALGRAPYSADAGLFEIDPLGVAAPRTEADVAALVRYASDQGIPLHPRGAGTGRTGGALGPGIVVDMSRHFRRIQAIGPRQAVVQAGVVVERLQAELARHGRWLGLDPPGAEAHTVGGLIGLDAGGVRSAPGGTIAGCVERLRVVFANGEIGELAQVDRPADEVPGGTFADGVARRLDVLLTWNADRLDVAAGAAGYALGEAARPDGRLDLARLIVGAEGSLAIVTEATLRTAPIARERSAVVLPFARLIDAAESVPECLRDRPSACELFDRRGVTIGRDSDAFLRGVLSEHAEAVLIVEFEGDELGPSHARASALGRRLDRAGVLNDLPVEVPGREECDRVVSLGRRIAPSLARVRGPSRPQDVVDRLRIPPARLPGFLAGVQALMMDQGLGWTVEARAAVSEVRVRPYLDLASEPDRSRVASIGAALRELARQAGGAASPGFGPDRLAVIRRQQGALFNANRELKFIFDPLNLINPGKIAGDDAKPMPATLRAQPEGVGPARADAAEPPPLLLWPGSSRLEQVEACNQCGACRSEETWKRMCPTFRATHDEAASPRAKVHVLRQLASGAIPAEGWGSEELKEYADLCVHCNLCRSECPAGVDVSSLMIETKAAHVATHGLSPDDWFLSRVDLWSELASRFPGAFNLLSRSRLARWVLERTFGLSRHRSLPRAQRGAFLRRADRLGLTRPRPHEPGPRVAYFVDIAANHFDGEVAESVVGLLRHAGVNVYVPRPQRGSGMPALVAGDLDRARELLEANLRLLGNAARDGYTIVCSEPAAALFLRHEALRLTDNLDARLVASNTREAGEYLAGLAARGDLAPPDVPVPVRIGYHQPCHLRALRCGTPGLDLLRSVPGIEAEFIDRGCSGMAGTYGLAARNFRTSLRAGRGLLRRLRESDLDLGSTECFACRLQMEQVVPKRTVHPLKLLALGYGLNPALRRHLVGAKRARQIT